MDASLSLDYFERCLINPPIFPGTQKPIEHLFELPFRMSAGDVSKDELSERVGELMGSELVKVVIALCINTITQESCSPREAKRLNKALAKVYDRKDRLVKECPKNLNLKKVATGASRNLDYLINAGKPDVTLQTEMNESPKFSDLRYKCVKEFSPARLQELLFDEIVGLTGFLPTN